MNAENDLWNEWHTTYSLISSVEFLEHAKSQQYLLGMYSNPALAPAKSDSSTFEKVRSKSESGHFAPGIAGFRPDLTRGLTYAKQASRKLKQ